MEADEHLVEIQNVDGYSTGFGRSERTMASNTSLSLHECDTTVSFPHVELFGLKCPRLLSWKVIHKSQTTGKRAFYQRRAP